MKEDGVNEFTDSDIIDLVYTEPTPVEEKEQIEIMTHCEAFQAIEQLIEYIEEQEEATATDLLYSTYLY